jgi:hypothetical protein
MRLLKNILHKLNGLSYPQEYLCLSHELFEHPLHLYLVENKKVIKDITNHHSFVGYNPLIFSFLTSEITPSESSTINIAFSQKVLLPNAFFSLKDAVAMLHLKKIREQATFEETIVYYEGLNGNHRFISSFQQYINQLHNRLYNRKPGNVFLSGNLLQQVQIAYSLPRNISLISVCQNEHFNLFPTDLHGPLSEKYYIISLRHQGKACQQVLSSKQILISQVDTKAYKSVYALGKNHMQEMAGKENYPFSNDLSPNFKLPVPQSALLNRELELFDFFTHGIHCLMLFKTHFYSKTDNISSTLAHIHNVYATWRQNNRFSGNYLLR